MRKNVYVIISLIAILMVGTGFTSCSKIPWTTKSKVAAELSVLKQQHSDELAKAKDAISTQKDVVIGKQENQLQKVADTLYGADQAFNFYIVPGRIDTIINNRVNEAWATAGKTPSYETIVKENERLEKELDETLTSMEDLKKNHDAAVAENTALAKAKEAEVAKIAQMKIEFDAKEKERVDEITKKQEELNKVNSDIIALQNKELDAQKATERLKAKLMWACGAAAVLCIIGAIYSPVGKSTLGMLGAGFSGATIAIPFIQGWMVLVGVLVILAIVIVIFLYDHNVSKKVNTNLINYVQDDKEKNPEGFAQSKENLKKWNATYVKDATGNIVTVPDKSVEKYIQTELMATGRLDVPHVKVI